MTWVAVGSGVISVAGGLLGFSGEKKKRKAIRGLQALNAQRLETQAKAVERQTEEDVIDLRRQLSRVVGGQRAAWGASGLAGGTGSALDVLADSITTGLSDVRRRREAGAVEAADLRHAAAIGDLSARAQLRESRTAGQAALIQGGLSAAGTIGSKFLAPTPTPTPKVP